VAYPRIDVLLKPLKKVLDLLSRPKLYTYPMDFAASRPSLKRPLWIDA
jgi:hypothetical protein